MKSNFTFYLVFILTFCSSTFTVKAQDTFSIVAADSITRELGSAGASCVDLFFAEIFDPSFSSPTFLTAIVPNKGAINVQSDFDSLNRHNAIIRFKAGDTPTQVLNWLLSHDATNDTLNRQYGVVGFVGNQVSQTAFTGSQCENYKGHVTGRIGEFHYAIQGNILKGKHVIDAMEANFRNTNGDLKCRLMAALQGANIIGADARCESNNTSSLFAFLQVTQPTDQMETPSFAINVKTIDNAQIEPIDSLQKLFTAKHTCVPQSTENTIEAIAYKVYPNPVQGNTIFIEPRQKTAQQFMVKLVDMQGKTAWTYKGIIDGQAIPMGNVTKGIYQLLIFDKEHMEHSQKLVIE